MRYLLPFLAMISLPPVWAEPVEVEVLGLFTDAALLKIDGTSQLLKSGETSPRGVTLLRADSAKAVIEYEGSQRTLLLSDRISSTYEDPGSVTVSVQMNDRGQYVTTGSINGRPVRFLIDTGANIVAMNAGMAGELGIDFSQGRKVRTATASGSTMAVSVVLDSVIVGGITVRNVRAAVLEGDYPKDILLGMSFLRHVEIQKNAGLMVLTSQL